MKSAVIGIALLFAAGAPTLAKNMQLPPHVTLRPSGSMSGDYIDTISQDARGAAFARLKLCVAQNVSNPPITITGGTDTAFKLSTGKTQTSTIPGGDVFKHEDAEAATVIAMGTIDGGSEMMGLTHSVIRFELLAVTAPERTTLTFSNIGRATVDTGSVTNHGFIPVGAWKGAKPLAVIQVLEALGSRIDACLR